MNMRNNIFVVRCRSSFGGRQRPPKHGATDRPALLYAPQGLAIHQWGHRPGHFATSYSTNLMGLAFTGTTTYDFYSTPLMASVNLPTSDEGQGTICMQNSSPTAANDFQVTGQMRGIMTTIRCRNGNVDCGYGRLGGPKASNTDKRRIGI